MGDSHRKAMAAFAKQFNAMLDKVITILQNAPQSPSNFSLIPQAMIQPVSKLKSNLIGINSTHVLLQHIKQFQDDLHQVYNTNHTAYLERILRIIYRHLTKGLEELNSHSNQLEEMIPIMGRHLHGMGSEIMIYRGTNDTYVHSIGQALINAGLQLGYQPTTAFGLHWQALDRLATIVDRLHTIPRTKAAMRRVTS